ncbi:MAG: hypothetical protein OEZ01_13190 [Candidatus Heimdallarchaeota archaeon]|nr:hypothetical protein [Candidatus Heimdallarchaeota archaeon]MDH5646962.1 hypothetical protein [Candidatus Heimdallarchaeota archaeon]
MYNKIAWKNIHNHNTNWFKVFIYVIIAYVTFMMLLNFMISGKDTIVPILLFSSSLTAVRDQIKPLQNHRKTIISTS